MKVEAEKECFLKKGLFWCILHRRTVRKAIEEIKRDNKRLSIENESLVKYNRKLENHLRLKAIEIKQLQKRLKGLEK